VEAIDTTVSGNSAPADPDYEGDFTVRKQQR
jgi:hypothetical protein